jgi:hypothetical protein
MRYIIEREREIALIMTQTARLICQALVKKFSLS